VEVAHRDAVTIGADLKVEARKPVVADDDLRLGGASHPMGAWCEVV
jgi:hypothetical protein